LFYHLLQDGPHSLDDSMSALLSSSSTGTRKKSMGTHYKRPGPPTPSKNGGRLSFGSSEPPREILREFGDHHNNTSKTPARFKFLTQRFSVGSSGLPRDEVSADHGVHGWCGVDLCFSMFWLFRGCSARVTLNLRGLI